MAQIAIRIISSNNCRMNSFKVLGQEISVHRVGKDLNFFPPSNDSIETGLFPLET